MRRRFKRRGRKMFTRRRRFSRKRGTPSYGGTLKFATRFKGGRRTTQVPIAQVYFTKHPALESEAISITAPNPFIQGWQPSALFNWDLAGADAGFAASMLSFWQNYVVLGYSYHVIFHNTDNSNAIRVGVLPLGNVVTDPTTFDDFMYRPGAQTKMLTTKANTQATAHFSGYVNSSKIIGTKVWQDSTFYGEGTADPITNSAFLIAAQNLSTLDATAMSFRIKFVFYVKWFNRTAIGDPSTSLAALPTAKKVDVIKKLELHLKMLKGGDPKISNDEEEKEVMEVEIEGLESVVLSEVVESPVCPTCHVIRL